MTDKEITPVDTSTPVEAVPSKTRISPIWIALGVLFFLVLIAGVVLAITVMVKNPAQTETIRDIMIIFIAFESLIIGLAIIILLVQLARLTDRLRYEIGPILEATNETIGSLRGTTKFLSKNLVTPVVKANSTFAALRRAIELVDFRRSK
ncbi:MAG: hypothetical protein KAI06_09705 [Anaerolineales bacterium]|nr:hypothetical protein [Anaerolineales bacterium]